VTQPVVSDYEHGELRVHGELIIKLAEILRTSANEILGLEKNGKTEAAIKNRRLHRRLYRQSISFLSGIRKLCSGPSMPFSQRRAEDEKGGYLSLGQASIVRHDEN